MVSITDNYIQAIISEHGAELCSLLHNGFEYIWQADPKYWGRHAPILFPIVGKVYNNEYRVDGRTYSLPQHGFARDSEFQLIKATDTEATFMLQSDDDTFKIYPYKFELLVKYELVEKQLKVTYTVHNTDDKDIYFQIGGYPAFNYPNHPFSKGYLQLLKDGKVVNDISVKHPNTSGYISNYKQSIELTNGTLPIKDYTFDNGSLILENNQCDTIKMINGNGATHLTITSKAKLFAIWSPERKNAPFVCIEPWNGKADEEGFNGDFKDKPFINILTSKEEHTLEYTITI